MAQKLVFMNTPAMKKVLTSLEAMSREGLNEAVTGALIECHKYVTPKLEAEIEKHFRTGRTANSLDTNPKVNYQGDYISIGVGFHITQGGLASIFLMYGTPKMAPDINLYNAVYGPETKKQLRKIQRDYVTKTFYKYFY